MPPGGDPGAGMHDLAEYVAETLDIGPGTRVFEVDCGDGQFLFPFYSNGYVVGGTDADAAAIAHARGLMPEGMLTVGAASALDPSIPWGVVICRSLSGDPDLDHLRGLVARMFAKATHAVALLGVAESQHQPLLRTLAEVGASAIQIDGAHVFARV